MSAWVYVLTPQGRSAAADAAAGLPPQLRQLLALIDGQRTREEILALSGRSAVHAGGLSWLASAGFIERRLVGGEADSRQPADEQAARHSDLGTPTAAPAPTSAWAGEGLAHPAGAAASPSTRASLLPLQATLAAYLTDAMARHLDEDGAVHRRRVQRAQSLSELLECLNPLIDAVLDAAGPQAAAELADGAAAILQPQGRR